MRKSQRMWDGSKPENSGSGSRGREEGQRERQERVARSRREEVKLHGLVETLSQPKSTLHWRLLQPEIRGTSKDKSDIGGREEEGGRKRERERERAGPRNPSLSAN